MEITHILKLLRISGIFTNEIVSFISNIPRDTSFSAPLLEFPNIKESESFDDQERPERSWPPQGSPLSNGSS